MRQTLALQARLSKDARAEAEKATQERAYPSRADPDEPAAPPDPKTVAIRRRRDWLVRGVERCVWNEYERDEEGGEFIGGSLLTDLDERLSDLMADPDAFLALDPDALLVALSQELGLTPPTFHPPAPPVPPAPPDGLAAPAVNGHDSS